MSLFNRIIKRLFDIIFSIFGLLFTFPVIFISFLAASSDVKGNGIFSQPRIGKNGKVFNVYKIKTMKDLKIGEKRSSITYEVVSEITKSGFFLRKYKIDELPQLWNVLIGDMSFVGPRPDVSGYADLLEGDDRVILNIRPGITGPASLKYRDEDQLLSSQPDPKYYNDRVIWPDKIKINKQYISDYSFLEDLKYIITTLKR